MACWAAVTKRWRRSDAYHRLIGLDNRFGIVDRLVAEANEHVLSFDWADVARQVAAVYRATQRAAARSG